MIDVRVGGEKSESLRITDAQYVKENLINDPRFIRLLGECADECAIDWSRGKTVDEREAAFATLQGMRKFAKWLQIVMERGAPRKQDQKQV